MMALTGHYPMARLRNITGLAISLYFVGCSQIIDPTTFVVLVGAGDIAVCEPGAGAARVAALLDSIQGQIFTAGDNAYNTGSWEEFVDCYGPTWGRHKTRTRPSVGNHDTFADNTQSYYAYFGDNAGPVGKGWYSYDLGEWHIVVVNSMAPRNLGSAQLKWLEDDLALNSDVSCTLAYWHHPRWSSASTVGVPASHRLGSDASMAPIWDVLYDAGAEVVVSGHDHVYERFMPTDRDGIVHPFGVRQFIVGTGGFGPNHTRPDFLPTSEVFDSNTLGVIKFSLHAHHYEWAFIDVAGVVRDSGSQVCH